MENKHFTKKLLAKLARGQSERLEEERNRTRLSKDISNTYRDRRENRQPFARCMVHHARMFFVGIGMFVGTLVHLRFGINLIICVAAFAACTFFIFERWRQIKRARDAHFD